MINFLSRNNVTIAGAFVGALAGYVYYVIIGCVSGNCSITSSPINSTVYGLALGSLLFNLFEKNNNK